MHKILYMPLDERPCNYDFIERMLRGSEFSMVRPDKGILGERKIPGDPDKIGEWMLKEAEGCEGAVISVDMLVYSGIVPSRLHHEQKEVLLARLGRLRQLREKCPSMPIYAFSLIMRNPQYSSSEEEPDYYEDWGWQIHRYGVITHKEELGIATPEEQAELADIEAKLPQEVLGDYLGRRELNIEINKALIALVAEGIVGFALFPQDDSSPYGLTAKDQKKVRAEISRLKVDHKIYMYPDADGVGNTLTMRLVNHILGRTPLVHVRYSSVLGPEIIPLYEDRPLGETLKYHILTCGGILTDSLHEADMVLFVNIPSDDMQEANQMRHTLQYDAFRTLPELFVTAKYCLEKLGKPVVFGDVAYANGGDKLLLSMLQEYGLTWEVAGYAGWNTSSNTLATAIPMGMLYGIYGKTKAHLDFLALRYLEDVGYCGYVRQAVQDEGLVVRSGYKDRRLDGERGKTRDNIQAMLEAFAAEHIEDADHKIRIRDCWMPWNRLFEVGLDVEVEGPAL